MGMKGMRVLTRRRVLQGAAAAPVAGAALLVGCTPADGGGATAAKLEAANAMLDNPLPPERLPRIVPAVRMNHAFFGAVRDLEMDDLVEPAVTFRALGPENGA